MSAYYGALLFFLILQWVLALGRCYVRLCIVRKFGYDDAAMVLTLLVSSAFSGCLIYTYNRAGTNSVYVLKENVVIATIHVVLAAQVTYILATTCLKVALGLLLLRVLIKKWMIYTIYTVMFVSVAYGISYFFVVLFQCGNPLLYPWRIIENKVCLSHRTIDGTSYTHAIITALGDWVYAVLPMIYLYSSNLDMRSKVSVGVILSIGSVGSILTIIRIGYIHDLTNVTATFLSTAQGIAIMSAAELSIGVTCISLACYKPFFSHFFPRRHLIPSQLSHSSSQHAEMASASRSSEMATSGHSPNPAHQIYTPQTNRYMRTANASGDDIKLNLHVSERASTGTASEQSV